MNKKNQIVVWYDNDSVILFHHIYPHILKLDNLLKTQCVNIVVDSCLINEPVFNNINVTYMRHGWFEKEVFRSSAHGGNNASDKGEQAKGVELLILNYNPETGEKLN